MSEIPIKKSNQSEGIEKETETRQDIRVYLEILKEVYADFRNRDQVIALVVTYSVLALEVLSLLIYYLRAFKISIFILWLLGVFGMIFIFKYLCRLTETRNNCYYFMKKNLDYIEMSDKNVKDEISGFMEKTLQPRTFSKKNAFGLLTFIISAISKNRFPLSAFELSSKPFLCPA